MGNLGCCDNSRTAAPYTNHNLISEDDVKKIADNMKKKNPNKYKLNTGDESKTVGNLMATWKVLGDKVDKNIQETTSKDYTVKNESYYEDDTDLGIANDEM